MEFKALAADLKKGPVAPLYLVYGPESLLRERAIDQVKSAEPFQQVRIDTGGLEWPAIADELYTPGFFTGRKLVVLVDEGNFVHNHREDLKAYAAAPSPSAVLAASIPSDKAPSIPESAHVRHVACKPLLPSDLVIWVQSEFQRLGKSVDRAAVAALVERFDGTLGMLASRVENIVSYAGSRATVGIADVQALVRGEPAHKVYELALAAASKRPGRALEILHRLLAEGEAAPRLLWQLAWEYRKVVEAKRLLEAGRRRFEVTSLLQITYYPDKFLALVDGHTLQELLEKHAAILETDVALKSGGGAELPLMSRLVLRLAAAPAMAR
ncbi:MAG TPA: DNA polymerase III subunit delta [Planctomycetota bacterium]|nr:DNA polymerase III subunit delta [Planctomycetota bacterium]